MKAECTLLKRMLCMLLSVIMLIGVSPVSVWAENTEIKPTDVQDLSISEDTVGNVTEEEEIEEEIDEVFWSIFDDFTNEELKEYLFAIYDEGGTQELIDVYRSAETDGAKSVYRLIILEEDDEYLAFLEEVLKESKEVSDEIDEIKADAVSKLSLEDIDTLRLLYAEKEIDEQETESEVLNFAEDSEKEDENSDKADETKSEEIEDNEAEDNELLNEDNEANEASLEEDNEAAQKEADDEPKEEKTLSPFYGEVEIDDVIIEVSAPEGVFPEGAELYAQKIAVITKNDEEINDEQTQQAIEGAVSDVRGEDKTVAVSYTFDIQIRLNGEEIEPDTTYGNVNVSFKLKEKLEEEAEVNVYHVTESEEDSSLIAEELDATVAQSNELFEEDATDISFETDGFSYYVVEFTYNGLTYVMEGDTVVKLSEILSYLRIPEGDISDIECSNNELFTVEYAEDEEGKGEYLVIALSPFTSEEYLRLKVDGKEYEIKVTDSSKMEFVEVLYSSTDSPTWGKSGQAVTYVIKNNVGFGSYNCAGAGINIAENATVVIYVPANITLNARGRNAEVTNGREAGTYGGSPGICVPESSTLIITGAGSVYARGGNGDYGYWGANGGNGYLTESDNYYYGGYGGHGGGGGAGAGAGIGGSGGKGGDGGTQASYSHKDKKVERWYGDEDYVWASWCEKSSGDTSGTAGKTALTALTVHPWEQYMLLEM